jgi:exopolysaccharide biosynthesis polyprenyl glycosylphosphotransferase
MSVAENEAVELEAQLPDPAWVGLDGGLSELAGLPLSPRARPHGREWIVRRALLVADVTGVTLAFVVAQLLFGGVFAAGGNSVLEWIAVLAVTLPAWVVIGNAIGLYSRDQERPDHSTVDEISGLVQLVAIGVWIILLAVVLTGREGPDPLELVSASALAIAFVALARAGARTVCRRSRAYRQNTVIVGSGSVAQDVARKLEQHPEFGVTVAGFVDQPWDSGDDITRTPFLGPIERLPAILDKHEIDRVVIAFPTVRDQRILHVIQQLRHVRVQVDIVPRFFEALSPNADVHAIEGMPLVGLRPFRLSRSARVAKRATDLILATAAIVLLSPLLAAISVAIKLDSRGSVLFRQTRMGMGDRTFAIVKFRTMVGDADSIKETVAHLNQHASPGGDPRMFKIPKDPRVTRVGAFLRRTSLDELPQLLNVLRGEMSLVGPRPLILDEDRHVRHWGRRRLITPPGITGPWQVLGRSDIPFDEMIRLDYIYVTEWSLIGDAKWILRTVPALFRVRNAY